MSLCDYKNYYDLPLLKLFLSREKVRLSCKIRDTFSALKNFNKFKKTKLLRNSKSGKALIFGNGPRLIDCLENANENYKNAFDGEVFCCNSYILHENLINIKPDYYFLLDHMYFEEPSEKNIKKNYKYSRNNSIECIKENWEIT